MALKIRHFNRFLLLAASSAALLSGCAQMRTDSAHALDKAETETRASWSKLRGYLDLESQPKPVKRTTPQPRFCYKTYDDIVCYRDPVPGNEARLVAYQSSGGGTGYTIVPGRAKVKKDKEKDKPAQEAASVEESAAPAPPAQSAPVAAAPKPIMTPLPAAPPEPSPAAADAVAAKAVSAVSSPSGKPAPAALPEIGDTEGKAGTPPAPATAASPAVAPVPAPAPAATGKAEEKKLKEITFDPRELEPKTLVPEKIR